MRFKQVCHLNSVKFLGKRKKHKHTEKEKQTDRYRQKDRDRQRQARQSEQGTEGKDIYVYIVKKQTFFHLFIVLPKANYSQRLQHPSPEDSFYL